MYLVNKKKNEYHHRESYGVRWYELSNEKIAFGVIWSAMTIKGFD
jgi:hypothetical protein